MESNTASNSQTKLSKELSAAVLLLLVALPLNIGVAIAAGVPAETGLFSGFIGAVITGALSRCALLVSGPDAGIGALVAEMLQKHGIAALGPIVLIAGLMQLAIGLSKQARWFRAVSPAVVSGMLLGMGFLIIFSQFHIMLDDSPKECGFANLFMIPQACIDGMNHTAALLGVASISIAYGWSKLKLPIAKVLPPALVAIVIAAVIAEVMNLGVQKVQLPADLGITWLTSTPGYLKQFIDPAIWISAVTLTFVVSAQTAITVKALETASEGQERFNYDRELIAQGTGNMLSGIICGLPIAGVLLRSSANRQSGAKTKIPNMVHGWLMLFAAVLFPHLLEYIPTCALAAILVFIGLRMIAEIKKTIVDYPEEEKAILALTVFAILATNLFTGVIVGLIAAIAKELYRLMHLKATLMPPNARGVVTLKLSGAATFAHIPHLLSLLEEVKDKEELHVHLEEVTYLDHAVLQMFMEWEMEHREKLVIDWSTVGAAAGPKRKLRKSLDFPYLVDRRPQASD
ncbi:SulP family inorganic anion transporter [bacterium]|jgi:MFS superfamily sulfate permease-like transporter|nr:SulP family inorganic anion transporter [bacterium]